MEKKRVIKSLEKLEPEVRNLLFNEYPDGFEDNINRIHNAKNEPIFVVPLETDDTNYLIKVNVIKNDEGQYDVNIDEVDFKVQETGIEEEGDDDDKSPYADDPEEDLEEDDKDE